MNYEKRFNDEFQKALEAKTFPVEKLSCNWLTLAINSLRFASIISLGINPEDWLKLGEITLKEGLTLYQFALLSNNLQARTPNELGISLYEYHSLMEEADEYVKIWQELSNSIREEVEEKLRQEAQMKKAAENGILKPIKAEA